MAMVVQHNIAAQLALGELNRNNDKLRKSLEKVSNGQKINSAKDDSSAYSISEKMREMVRTLNQDHQNVQNGSSLFKIADGGINSIVEELRNLKELAINAANDTNTDVDRATIQKEFQQKYANINDIAATTNYNGITLLDGTWSKRKIFETISPGTNANKIVHSGAVEPTGTITTISSGNYTINSDGVYELAAGYSGTITINSQNVKITQATSAILNNVYMVGSSGGNANLWIENLNIRNSQDKNFIQFQNSGNTLNFKGTNNYASTIPSFIYKAVVNIGEGLTVEGGVDGRGIFNFNSLSYGQNHFGALIGTNYSENHSNADIIVNSGNFNISACKGGAALVGSAIYGEVRDIIVNGGTFIDTNTRDANDAIIGGGGSFRNIVIDNATLIATYTQRSDPIIGTTNYNENMNDITITNSYIFYRGSGHGTPAIGAFAYNNVRTTGGAVGRNITIKNCIIDAETTTGAGIGCGAKGINANVEIGDITIINSDLKIKTGTGAGIGSGEGSHAGNITIIDTDLSNVTTGGGEVVGKGVNGTCGDITIINDGRSKKIISKYNPLKIHHGPHANQHTNFYINDMHTKSLGTGNLFCKDLNTQTQILS